MDENKVRFLTKGLVEGGFKASVRRYETENEVSERLEG
jgi:hypothetical protein